MTGQRNRGGPARALALLSVMLALPGCSAMRSGHSGHSGVRPGDELTLELPRECGVQLAMMPRRPARYREMPPACALPTAEEVARSCAVHDRVSEPGYVGQDCDDATGLCSPPEPPLPAYRVAGLECRYSNDDESAALCRFRLALPGEASAGRAVEVPFDHRFWADHGPTHHIYGTMWMLGRGADCTAEGA